MVGLRKEGGALVSEDCLENRQNSTDWCILYKRKLLNWLFVYRAITVAGSNTSSVTIYLIFYQHFQYMFQANPSS